MKDVFENAKRWEKLEEYEKKISLKLLDSMKEIRDECNKYEPTIEKVKAADGIAY